MTSRSTSRSRKPIAGTCRTLKCTFSTPVISHWTRLQMKSPHWSEALSVLHVEGSWCGRLAEAAMRTPATNHLRRNPATRIQLLRISYRDRAWLDYPWKETRQERGEARTRV